MPSTGSRRVAIIGGGPVGALSALYFSHAGWEVELYEMRSDLRQAKHLATGTGKSINLALSERGINGLRQLGDGGRILNDILHTTIPMYGRMVHSGRDDDPGVFSAYDSVHGNAILSIDRADLNRQLLNECESKPNITIRFSHKLSSLDLSGSKGARATFEVSGQSSDGTAGKCVTAEHRTVVDLVIGADGAHSKVRSLMMKYVEMYFEQTYIPIHWVEFNLAALPSTAASPIAATPAPDPTSPSPTRPALRYEALHIWPASPSMFIAIPSLHHTFTCTLFAPPTVLAALRTPDQVLAFFRANFPAVVTLFGADAIVAQFFAHQHLPLVSIRAAPYHYADRCVIIGDAAHAMVPFYGQGMNAGFESARVLAECVFNHGVERGLALYSTQRVEDAWTIVELAKRNHEEMRAGVKKRSYWVRKWFEEGMMRWWPGAGVKTLYTRVSFSNDRYSEVLATEERQARLEVLAVRVLAAAVLVLVAYWSGVLPALAQGFRETCRPREL